MLRRYVLFGLFVFALVSGIDAPHAQMVPRSTPTPQQVPSNPRPYNPYGTPTLPQVPVNPYPDTPYASPANICSTQWGWCHLPAPTRLYGASCGCLTTQNQVVAGSTKFFPIAEGPLSPYLQPHTTLSR